MIALHHAGYALPATRASVASWCETNRQSAEIQEALRANGADNYHRADSESLLELGSAAIETTLEQAAVEPDQIDALLIYQTSPCSVWPMPYSLLGSLRKAAGLRSALAFSVSQQQCVSPIHGLRVVQAMFRTHPDWQRALIVGIDAILREDLRPIGTSGFHSDAASALLVTRDGRSRVEGIETYNDPKAVRGILEDGQYEINDNYLWSLISVLRRVMKAARISADQLTSILPHNVNLPAWWQAMDALRIPRDRLFTGNFPRIGHAFGSDVAINLADSGALGAEGNHLVFASGIGGCFGGFLVQTGLHQ